MTSAREAVAPTVIPAAARGLVTALTSFLTGAVTLSITPTVTFHVFPAIDLPVEMIFDITEDALSLTLITFSIFSFENILVFLSTLFSVFSKPDADFWALSKPFCADEPIFWKPFPIDEVALLVVELVLVAL